jgi:hypothetical protein
LFTITLDYEIGALSDTCHKLAIKLQDQVKRTPVGKNGCRDVRGYSQGQKKKQAATGSLLTELGVAF